MKTLKLIGLTAAIFTIIVMFFGIISTFWCLLLLVVPDVLLIIIPFGLIAYLSYRFAKEIKSKTREKGI